MTISIESQRPCMSLNGAPAMSYFALESARKRRRVRERLQRIMAELAQERRRLPAAGG